MVSPFLKKITRNRFFLHTNLMQRPEGSARPVRYASRQTMDAEVRYHSYELETGSCTGSRKVSDLFTGSRIHNCYGLLFS